MHLYQVKMFEIMLLNFRHGGKKFIKQHSHILVVYQSIYSGSFLHLSSMLQKNVTKLWKRSL